MALIPGTLPNGTKYPNDPQTLLDTFAGHLTAPSSGSISKTIVNAKGDVLAATSNNVVVRVPVGANGTVLTADSAQTAGVKWDSAINNAFINSLPALNTTPAGGNELVISDAGTAKRISVFNLSNATLGTAGTKNVANGVNLALGTGTGTQVGTTASQKLGFWGAAPITRPTAVPNISVSFTTGGTPTANGSVTVANSASPTNAELLDYCVELEATLENLLARLRTLGIIAT
jgi:hypothetical protein